MRFKPDNRPPGRAADSLHLVFQGGQLVRDLRAADPLLPARHDWPVVQEQFLGYWEGRPCFAVEIDPQLDLDPMHWQRGSLYQLLGADEDLFALAGRAAQLLAWERDHQYCGRCGAPMQADLGERAMRCEPCRHLVYPRISPCIITLITRGDELLLARNASFPGEMYSTLAGFIEAGESAEACLHREVAEEVGVSVCNLRYYGSQSWPFPSQLMLGFFAEYAGGEIVCDQEEIADARWFHHSALPQVPPPSSIAGRLIRDYVEHRRKL
jgi:NAD+ diphosphatase